MGRQLKDPLAERLPAGSAPLASPKMAPCQPTGIQCSSTGPPPVRGEKAWSPRHPLFLSCKLQPYMLPPTPLSLVYSFNLACLLHRLFSFSTLHTRFTPFAER